MGSSIGRAEDPVRRRRLLAALVLIGLALLASAAPGASPGARHALLIGISDYSGSGFDDLPGAARDIELVSEVLTSRLGFLPGEIRALCDRAATHRGIERAFGELADSVAPGDLVFIHYSGHGSLVRDFNDDEPTGQDQTLVPFGARWEESHGIDRFDILDDELNLWLGRIGDRLGPSGQLVMVSDACHSATNTRGPAPLVSRALPAAVQESHPRAQRPAERHALTNVVEIAAADVHEQAFEFRSGDGVPVGLFTWHWVAALESAAPDATWRGVFERAALGLTTLMSAVQHPRITGGNADRTILGGDLRERRGVRVVRADEDGLTLDAGLLAGVSVGSLYGLIHPEGDARVRITGVNDTQSRGRIERGWVGVGDVLNELAHAYTSEPVRLFLWVLDDSVPFGLLQPLQARLGELPGFAWVEDQARADLTVAILRPRRSDGEAKPVFTAGVRESIPQLDAAAAPEAWILDRGERLVHEDLITRLTRDDDEIARLAKNLARYRRQQEIRRLPALGHADMGIRTALIRYKVHPEPCDGCRYVKDLDGHIQRLPAGQPIDTIDQGNWPQGTLLSLSFENGSRRGHYVYVFELTPDGSVRAVHPHEQNRHRPVVQLPPGRSLALPDQGEAILLDQPGPVSVLVIATRSRIDPFRLTQEGFEPVRRGGCEGNPLQCLLLDAINGTRGTTTTGAWGAQLIDFQVQPSKTAPACPGRR